MNLFIGLVRRGYDHLKFLCSLFHSICAFSWDVYLLSNCFPLVCLFFLFCVCGSLLVV